MRECNNVGNARIQSLRRNQSNVYPLSVPSIVPRHELLNYFLKRVLKYNKQVWMFRFNGTIINA